MHNSRVRAFALGLSALALVALSCNVTGAAPSIDVAVALTQTQAAVGTQAGQPAAPEAVTPGAPADTVAPAETATETAEPSPTSRPPVVHTTQPGNPGGATNFVYDRSSKTLANERRAIGDDYTRNWLERPFSADAMEYQAHLDLTRVEYAVGAPWIYFTLFVEGLPPEGSTAAYAIEIDMDKDGRGDWLIAGEAPPDSNWTTDGVRAYRDTNNDVGASRPMLTDAPVTTGTGYDELVFDEGYATDPDAAWIRRASSGASEIEIAVKNSLIGQYGEFLWGGWTDEGVQNPAWSDYHDRFTLAEAGSPANDSSNYPLKAVSAVDSTCRWGAGFTPAADDPGVCPVPPTPTPEPVGSIAGRVTNLGGGFNDGKVKLGQGSCSSTGYKSTGVSSDGYYKFEGLPAGTYCVTVDTSSLRPTHTYGWDPVDPDFGVNEDPYRTVTLGANEEKSGVNFRYVDVVG
jgi:hypothetical protein